MKRSLDNFLNAQIISSTITFQDALTRNTNDVKQFLNTTRVLDNSICYGKEPLFLSWVKWSHDADFEEVLQMFNLLVVTGARHDANVDIFYLISNDDEAYLEFPVLHCLLSKPTLFPIKQYPTGSPLGFMIHEMKLIDNNDEELLKLEDEVVILITELFKRDPASMDFYLCSSCNDHLAPAPTHVINPLICAIDVHSLKLVTLLLTLHPLLDLDFFFVDKSENDQHWVSCENFMEERDVPESIEIVIEHAASQQVKYLDEVGTLLDLTWNRDLSHILRSFLSRPPRVPIVS
jgi:hypothetical protein